MKIETQIKKEISTYLDSLGEKCWHVSFHNMGYTRKGIGDRLACYRGRFFMIEAKRDERAKESKWQERERKSVLAAGGYAIVAWSVEQVQEVIRAIDADLDRVTTDDLMESFMRERASSLELKDGKYVRKPFPL